MEACTVERECSAEVSEEIKQGFYWILKLVTVSSGEPMHHDTKDEDIGLSIRAK